MPEHSVNNQDAVNSTLGSSITEHGVKPATQKVAALYHFTRLDTFESRREPLLNLCIEEGLKGTLLLAHEGINGTVAGPDAGIDRLIAYLNDWPEINGLDVKYSRSSGRGFLRMKVRLKKEIVTMGKADIDPLKDVGTYVEPQDWNDLIARQDVMVIDTRNTYETRIGKFERAVDPETRTFRAFPEWADKLKADPDRPKAVAMYCTGGIRCEKASAYMKQIGFEEVYHLKGGILKYLEEIPEEKTMWEGDCFVFDERVSLKHGLVEGDYDICFACKDPLSEADRNEPGFEEGVSCHRCINTYSEDQKEKFRQRQRQIGIAAARGEAHLGQETTSSKRSKK